MRMRTMLTAGLFALVALVPSGAEAQKLTVDWENAPLSDVARAFAAFSGRTIVVAPEVATMGVSAHFRDVDWQQAFDLILAKLNLVKRVDASGAIHVERRRPQEPRRE